MLFIWERYPGTSTDTKMSFWKNKGVEIHTVILTSLTLLHLLNAAEKYKEVNFSLKPNEVKRDITFFTYWEQYCRQQKSFRNEYVPTEVKKIKLWEQDINCSVEK